MVSRSGSSSTWPQVKVGARSKASLSSSSAVFPECSGTVEGTSGTTSRRHSTWIYSLKTGLVLGDRIIFKVFLLFHVFFVESLLFCIFRS